jgi:hypothetical protein
MPPDHDELVVAQAQRIALAHDLRGALGDGRERVADDVSSESLMI